MMSEKMHSQQQFKKFMIMPLLQNKRDSSSKKILECKHKTIMQLENHKLIW